ncbi:MAG: choice-of-anchor L domain-containing protein [Nannocystaceae bacterium]
MRRRSWLSLLQYSSLALVSATACSGDDEIGVSETTAPTGVTISTAGSFSTSVATQGETTTESTSNSGTATQGETTTAGTTDSTTTDSTTTAGTTDSTTTASTTDPTDTDSTTGVLPCTEADCNPGEFCNPDTGTCDPGCNDDTDCQGQTYCDVDSNTCKGCLVDGDCSLGTVCQGGECIPGCNDNQPCQGGLACCTGECVDPLVDLDNCGGCGIPCDAFPNADPLCDMGQCLLGACVGNFQNCDGNNANGCENNGACACNPGEQIACYSGDEDTKNVGICKEGVATCNAQGTEFGPCVGEVLPQTDEVCANAKDDNCNGQVDENPDADNDGWGVCDGDCCDSIGPNCLNPNLVNPGAFEVMGNMVDDDCDGAKDNPLPICDNNNLASNSSNPIDYAKAIDLCQITTENPPLAQKTWGVISGAFNRSNGAGTPSANARSIRPGFGSVITPKLGSRIAVLSTGNAADSNDTNPGYSPFQGGTNLGTPAAVPNDWLVANGNNLPNAPGCPDPQGGATGQDTIQLKLRVRVPTNANSFSVQMYFFSSEYPEWVCSPYNDFFVSLVTSTNNTNPFDKNIAVYKTNNNQLYPVGVNLVKATNGLFTQCKNGTVSCAYPPQANYNGCVGNNELTGTGFDPLNPAPQFGGDPGYCGSNNQVGGGTSWLKMSGNVTPGETMEIRFDIWDTGDQWYDSLVLLDSWQWSVQASQPGVSPN